MQKHRDSANHSLIIISQKYLTQLVYKASLWLNNQQSKLSLLKGIIALLQFHIQNCEVKLK